ncbi:hypothetical protein EJ06DRAFT_78833 [Trichodelitschia bisporula]|uniref:Uncharacterized protein n=1 Tax=Trichodelitschia bisporula TaxID=703511 RepID=A0A6G1HT95_9PEZI|nr:hypothetical protein EJ06DRAFT_78833 [Trichodelitschia bisporula]
MRTKSPDSTPGLHNSRSKALDRPCIALEPCYEAVHSPGCPSAVARGRPSNSDVGPLNVHNLPPPYKLRRRASFLPRLTPFLEPVPRGVRLRPLHVGKEGAKEDSWHRIFKSRQSLLLFPSSSFTSIFSLHGCFACVRTLLPSPLWGPDLAR